MKKKEVHEFRNKRGYIHSNANEENRDKFIQSISNDCNISPS